MAHVMLSVIESGILFVLLCVAPIVLFLMLARRRIWAPQRFRRAFRAAMAVTAAMFAFNLGVATFGAPRFAVAAISDGIDTATLLAFVFGWASAWGVLALAILAPRRRYRLAASGTG